MAEDEVGRDWRDLIEAGLPKFAFDIVFLSKAEPAVRLEAHVRRKP